MLAGTETSLSYEININFTNKPQNLKLYTDENFQNELYVENDILNLKDFIGLNDKQQISKVIYWGWKEETGDTEEEIHENDLKDSEFMGKKLQMAISVTGKQVMSANNNYYMVTLDANGGKIGSSASVQKQVVCGEPYGKLPTPTRRGYTFAGWASKNLLDGDSLFMAISGCTISDEGYYNYLLRNGYYKYSRDGEFYTDFPKNKQYTLSFTAYSDGTGTFDFIFAYTDGTSNHVKNFDASTTPQRYVLTSYAGKDIEHLTLSYGSNGYIFIKDIQLEEGTIATEYEPYYVINTTSVTQNENRTLTAIWRKNEN